MNPNFLTFEITYRVTSTGAEHTVTEKARDPVMALNRFHRMMQLRAGFAHDAYVVKSLCRVVWPTSGPATRSFYDLPASQTPNLRGAALPSRRYLELPLGVASDS